MILYKKITLFLVIIMVSIFGVEVHQMAGNVQEFRDETIILNPYNIAPLSASFNTYIEQNGELYVTVEGKGKNGIEITKSFPHTGGILQVPILGLYPDYKNQIKIVFRSTGGNIIYSEDLSILTEKVRSNNHLKDNIFSELQVTGKLQENKYNDLYLFSEQTVLFDQNGDIRWYLDKEDLTVIYAQLRNGNIIIESNKEEVGYHAKYFYEISMMGEIMHKYGVDNYIHHDIVELSNLNLLASSSSQAFSSMADPIYRSDTIVEIDRSTGEVLKELDLNTILPGIRPINPTYKSVPHPGKFEGAFDTSTGNWVHINSLYEDGGDIIVSLRHLSMVISIDWETQTLNWVFSHNVHDYNGLEEYTLDMNTENENRTEFLFPLAQHTATITSEGNLLIFDNGTNRDEIMGKEKEKQYSRILEYSIDKENKKIELMSSYIDPTYIYTPITGSVYEGKDNHKIIGYTHNIGQNSQLVELDENNREILRIEDKSGDTYYRAMKIGLYEK